MEGHRNPKILAVLSSECPAARKGGNGPIPQESRGGQMTRHRQREKRTRRYLVALVLDWGLGYEPGEQPAQVGSAQRARHPFCSATYALWLQCHEGQRAYRKAGVGMHTSGASGPRRNETGGSGRGVLPSQIGVGPSDRGVSVLQTRGGSFFGGRQAGTPQTTEHLGTQGPRYCDKVARSCCPAREGSGNWPCSTQSSGREPRPRHTHGRAVETAR